MLVKFSQPSNVPDSMYVRVEGRVTLVKFEQ